MVPGEASEGGGGRSGGRAPGGRAPAGRDRRFGRLLQNWSREHTRAFRWILLGVVFLSGLTLFPRQEAYRRAEYAVGTVLAKPVIAEFDFPIRKERERLRGEQQAAMAAVPPVLVLQDSVAVEALAALGRLRRSIDDLRGNAAEVEPFDEPGIALSQNAYAVLLMEGTSAVFAQARERLQGYFTQGILSAELEERLRGVGRAALVIGGVDWVGPVDRFVTRSRLQRARDEAGDPQEQTAAELVTRFARPNITLDGAATERRRRLARDGVDRSVGMVLKGEEILGAHKRIWQEDLLKLESYEEARERRAANLQLRDQILSFLGRVMILILALAAVVQFLVSYRRRLLSRQNDLLLLAAMAALGLLLGGTILNVLRISGLLIPVAAFAVIIALLYDELLALACAGFLAITVGLVGDGGLDVIVILGLGSMAAVMSVRQLRDRRELYRLLLFVPLVHLAALGALGLMRSTPLDALLGDVLYLVANPFLAAGIALFAVPLSESFFDKCTNLRLLELLDLNRPLLRRLMLEAPGTYHHSLMVGTLAEAGAAHIGANALLARVSGYYHDIGKLNKPDYFIENLRPGQKNPHDKLGPAMSRLILEAHVRDGVALAKESKLPQVVRDGIVQHHATGLMTFFYHRALQKDPQTSETEYRYPGPRPQSREAAVLLLADQIDAVSRSLEDPTPSRLRGVVKQLIEKRTLEGELDESDLTLKDLAALREAFIPILTVLFHGRTSSRIAYPKTEHARGKPGAHPEPAAKAEN
ncbi:MAG: HDIG domain-containing protein [Candidatus Eisenbacteria sp.]|nr:HDIG domain-containing protein [Candidatus Eisenbacteria bacterium]